MIEGMYGTSDFSPAGTELFPKTYGLGFRTEHYSSGASSDRGWIFSPGLELYYTPKHIVSAPEKDWFWNLNNTPDNFLTPAASMDFIYLFRVIGNMNVSLGGRIGVGVGVSGTDSYGTSNSGKIYSDYAIFAGLRL